jgi:hypothetical protein
VRLATTAARVDRRRVGAVLVVAAAAAAAVMEAVALVLAISRLATARSAGLRSYHLRPVSDSHYNVYKHRHTKCQQSNR